MGKSKKVRVWSWRLFPSLVCAQMHSVYFSEPYLSSGVDKTLVLLRNAMRIK
jgi:hypothetical protein